MTYSDSPLTRSATAVLPLLIEAHGRLYGLAAPKASRLADRIGDALATLIDIAGDVEAYGNKWCGGDMERLATQLREATREYHGVMAE